MRSWVVFAVGLAVVAGGQGLAGADGKTAVVGWHCPTDLERGGYYVFDWVRGGAKIGVP